MSRWGRAQDALHDLYEVDLGYGRYEPGVVQKVMPTVTIAQWSALIEPILEAVAPIFQEPPLTGRQEGTDA